MIADRNKTYFSFTIFYFHIALRNYFVRFCFQVLNPPYFVNVTFLLTVLPPTCYLHNSRETICAIYLPILVYSRFQETSSSNDDISQDTRRLAINIPVLFCIPFRCSYLPTSRRQSSCPARWLGS